MIDDRPSLFTGGARRSRLRRRRRGLRRRADRRRADRRPRFSRALFLVPVVGGLALLAILVGSTGGGGSGAGQVTTRPESLAQPAKPPSSLEPAAGGGDARFAVKLSGPDVVRLRFSHPPRAG